MTTTKSKDSVKDAATSISISRSEVIEENAATVDKKVCNSGCWSSSKSMQCLRVMISISVHLFSLYIYYKAYYETIDETEAVLDELHLDNDDIEGRSEWTAAFVHDYWGRHMHNPSSHKSWRPLSVLSFRFINLATTGSMWKSIVLHRAVNVLLHSAAAELVCVIGLLLCPDVVHPFLFKCLVKLAFVMHPVHVEVVANAANRPHVLAVLFSLLCCDSRVNIGIFVTALMCSLLSSETAIFQFPAIAITMLAIHYNQSNGKSKPKLRFWRALTAVLDRCILAVIIGILYLTLRYMLDTLSIPKGLIRPAENPFVSLDGVHRFLNYSYITALHVWKSFGVDFIGRSHEYGFNCIPTIQHWTDPDGRIMLPLATFALLICTVIASACWSLAAFLNVLMGLSWFVALFPICGVLRVGTFVADRICMPCTVPVSILTGYVATKSWQLTSLHPKKRKMWQLRIAFALNVFYYTRTYSSIVHSRVTDWMTNEGLLSSSLRACPESAKSNLEISKIYSGLYPDKLNLTLAKQYLDKAELIDPDYCDIHQQFAGILFQEQKYLLFEDRLTKSVVCPFTLSWGLSMFHKYWDAVVQEKSPSFGGKSAMKRREKHANIIRKAAEQATLEDEMEQKLLLHNNNMHSADSSHALDMPHDLPDEF